MWVEHAGGEPPATEVDLAVRRHLTWLLLGIQCGADDEVARLARSETHRLVGAIRAGLRDHELDVSGWCAACQAVRCSLRVEISHALLPVLPPAPHDGG